MIMAVLRKYTKLPIHIVEDHNDALPHLYRALATKHLPFKDNLLVHFDSHPDLLLNPKLKSSDVFDKTRLYEKLSIENWILPSAFAGHFNTIVWIKPPWSHQIPDGCFRFSIGVEKNSGFIRVSSDLLYFISEMLYCSEENMESAKLITLYVMTMDFDAKKFSCHENTIKKLISEHEHYVLDVDLDFFSTMNPFIEMLASVNGYEKLQQIYKFDLDFGNGRTIYDNQNDRKNKINALHSFFQKLEDMAIKSDSEQNINYLIPETFEEDIRETLTCLVTDVCLHIDVPWLMIHDAGCTCDSPETLLPHHVSNNEEIAALMHVFSNLIVSLVKPVLVTLARSSLDDYCPPSQVEMIQQSCCYYLTSTYSCDIQKHY